MAKIAYLENRRRITPAYAGKSPFTMARRIYRWDHPRLRGEKAVEKPYFQSRTGSPPLTRGKERFKISKKRRIRITPAYAGKRPELFLLLLMSKDHPRLRGEKITRIESAAKNKDHPRLRGEKLLLYRSLGTPTGSPPLTRGKGFQQLLEEGGNRITPAYAGKSENCDSIRCD